MKQAAWWAGTLEEKVFQRQLSKEGLSNVVNQSGKSAASHMSAEDLADLFTPEFDSLSSTYDSMVDDSEASAALAATPGERAVINRGQVCSRPYRNTASFGELLVNGIVRIAHVQLQNCQVVGRPGRLYCPVAKLDWCCVVLECRAATAPRSQLDT